MVQDQVLLEVAWSDEALPGGRGKRSAWLFIVVYVCAGIDTKEITRDLLANFAERTLVLFRRDVEEAFRVECRVERIPCTRGKQIRSAWPFLFS